MTTSTTRTSDTAEEFSLPIDIETMRASARRLLTEEAELPGADELETLTLLLRGHIMLAIPEVEAVAGMFAENDVPRACALACVGEARIRLDLKPGPALPAAIAYAQRLARSVNSLCDHYENLGYALTSETEERWHDPGSGPGCMVKVYVCVDGDPEAAYQRILDHGMTCQTCRTLDKDGNANSECATARRLHLSWRMTQRHPQNATETPPLGGGSPQEV